MGNDDLPLLCKFRHQGTKLQFVHLRIIGSTSYAHIRKEDHDESIIKLAPAGEKLVLIRYSTTSKGY